MDNYVLNKLGDLVPFILWLPMMFNIMLAIFETTHCLLDLLEDSPALGS